MKKTDGGVTAAKGFQAAGCAAGIKKEGTMDMAMIFSEVPCHAAGTFTTNVVKAAPVKWAPGDRLSPGRRAGGGMQQWDCQRVYRRGRHGLL